MRIKCTNSWYIQHIFAVQREMTKRILTKVTMNTVISFDWKASVDSLENGDICSHCFTLFGFQFNISVFSDKSQNPNFLHFKLSVQNVSFYILELIVTINLKNSNGPSNEISIPMKCVINKQNTSSETETDLDTKKLAQSGHVIDGCINFNVAISPIERSPYLLTHSNPNQNIDDIIKTILSPHKLMDESILNEDQASFLFAAAKSVLLSQPNLLRLRGPIILVGDLHGKYFDLIRIFTKFGFPDRVNYLFLGDYVDRGPDGLDIIYLLCSLKVKFPENIFLLRGNHECEDITSVNGFKEECEEKNADYHGIMNVFNVLPFAAIISDKIFVVHGGISPHLTSLDIIENVKRPVVFDTDHPVNDILWSDPNPCCDYYAMSDRGPFSSYGACAVQDFLKKFGFELIIRAHEIAEKGFEFPLGPTVPVITLFSCTDAYRSNKGAAMLISADLHYTFDVFKGLSTIKEGQYESLDFNKHISL